MSLDYECSKKCSDISKQMNSASKEVISCLSKVQAIERYLNFSKDSHSKINTNNNIKSKCEQSSQTMDNIFVGDREKASNRKNIEKYSALNNDIEKQKFSNCHAFGDSEYAEFSQQQTKQQIELQKQDHKIEYTLKKNSVKKLKPEVKTAEESTKALKMALENNVMIREFQETGKSIKSWINQMELAIKKMQLDSTNFCSEDKGPLKSQPFLDEANPTKEAQIYHALTNCNTNNAEHLIDFGTDIEVSINDILNQIRYLKELAQTFKKLKPPYQCHPASKLKKISKSKERKLKLQACGDIPSESQNIDKFCQKISIQRDHKKCPSNVTIQKEDNHESFYDNSIQDMSNSEELIRTLTILSKQLSETLKYSHSQKYLQSECKSHQNNSVNFASNQTVKTKSTKLDWLELDFPKKKGQNDFSCSKSKTNNFLTDRKIPISCCECCVHMWQQVQCLNSLNSSKLHCA